MELLLAFEGIHQGEPSKLIWLGLMLLAVTLKSALLLRMSLGKTFYPFPGFSVMLATSTVASVLQFTPLWGLWGEIMIALGTFLFAVEIVYLAPRRSHDRSFYFFMALAIFGSAIYVSPPPYPTSHAVWYYLRLYSTVGAFAAIAVSAAYRRSQRSYSPRHFIAHNLTAIPWLIAIGMMSQQRLIGVTVQIGCLVAWHLTAGSSLRDRRYRRVLPRAPHGYAPGLFHGVPPSSRIRFQGTPR